MKPSTMLTLVSLSAVAPLAACQNQYITQVDSCAQSCVNNLISKNCNGDSNNWQCFCNSSDVGDNLSGIFSSDCASILVDCGLSSIGDITNKVKNICDDQVNGGNGNNNNNGVAPALVEGLSWKAAVGVAAFVPWLL